MRPGQPSGEGDAAAGDLCSRRVRERERRGDGDGGAAAAATAEGGRGDDRRLGIRAAVDGNRLAGAEAGRARSPFEL